MCVCALLFKQGETGRGASDHPSHQKVIWFLIHSEREHCKISNLSTEIRQQIVQLSQLSQVRWPTATGANEK